MKLYFNCFSYIADNGRIKLLNLEKSVIAPTFIVKEENKLKKNILNSQKEKLILMLLFIFFKFNGTFICFGWKSY